MSDKTRSVVVAAGSVTTNDGKKHKQGATVELPDLEARNLLRAGLVREAKSEAPVSTEKKGA